MSYNVETSFTTYLRTLLSSLSISNVSLYTVRDKIINYPHLIVRYITDYPDTTTGLRQLRTQIDAVANKDDYRTAGILTDEIFNLLGLGEGYRVKGCDLYAYATKANNPDKIGGLTWSEKTGKRNIDDTPGISRKSFEMMLYYAV